MLEAFGYGRTCIVPNHGAFPDLIQFEGKASGCLFQPANIDSLENAVVSLWNDAERIEMLQENAAKEMRQRFRKHYINQQWDIFLKQVANRQPINFQI